MAVPKTPEWLTKRDATLKPGIAETTVFVVFAGSPQYRLDVVPAEGKFACSITQAVNGHRSDSATTYPSPAAALDGGLEHLRSTLGW